MKNPADSAGEDVGTGSCLKCGLWVLVALPLNATLAGYLGLHTAQPPLPAAQDFQQMS